MRHNSNGGTWFFIALVAIGIFGYIAYTSPNFGATLHQMFSSEPVKCEGDECTIVTECRSNADCMVACGCECVSSASQCPAHTQGTKCKGAEQQCGCANNVCAYSSKAQ